VANPRLADVVAVLDEQYPPQLAEEWDAVGLVCGRPTDVVSKVLFAVDPHPDVMAEALDWGADLVVTHHPLLLTPVHGVSNGWKGEMLHSLIRSGIGLFCAHTNADVADGGVNDALAALLGVSERAPLDPVSGLGRVGRLSEPTTLGAFSAVVAAALPATQTGLRVAGDLSAQVRTVAVCGGAGGSLVDVARESGADVYVTADLRHHRALDAGCDGGPALIDASHWATEWPWLPAAADRLVAALEARGTTVEARVCEVVTDPWTQHRPSST
jgi:dinuclear metal center YbgI/SA1388 family protein